MVSAGVVIVVMGLVDRFSNVVHFALPAIGAVLTWLATFLVYRDSWGRLSRPIFLRAALASLALFFPASLVYHPAGPFLLTGALTVYIGSASRRRPVIAAGVAISVISIAQGSEALQHFLVPHGGDGSMPLSEIVGMERVVALVTGGLLLIVGVVLMRGERLQDRRA